MPIAKQREQVVVEPIDPFSACAVDTVRVLAREGSSDCWARQKGKRCDALKRASHQLVHQSLFSTLWRENNETKRELERRKGTVNVRAE